MSEQQNRNGQTVPAFLSDNHRGLLTRRTTTSRNLPTWTPSLGTRKALSALEAVPKLTAQIGLSAGVDSEVEILPGSPTTVVITSGGQLRGMVVLHMDGDEARALLGFPPITTADLAIDQLWEEQREVATPESILAELW